MSKKFSIFLVSFLIIFFALSQAQAVKFPGSGIWNSSGNVGIGTTNPGAKLDVNGNINSPSSQIGSGSVWSKNWTGSVSVPPGNGTSNLETAFIAVNPISYRIRLFVVGDTSTQTGAVFLVYNNKSYNANTNNWTAKLVSRAGSTSNEVNLVVNSTSGTVSVSHYHSTGTYTVGFMVQELQTSNQSSLDIFGADNNWVNDTGKLYYNSGNVGIGTISPVAKLDVSGSFQAGSTKITGLSGAGNAVVMSDNSGNLYNTALSTFVSANTLWSGTRNGNIWNGDSGGGNVGIGTTAPGAKLDVRGNLRIGGSSNENYLAFRGTSLDNQTPYTLSYIGERIYGGTEQSELLIFKGNDYAPSSGPDRIRLIAGELRFDTYNSATGYPTDLNAAAAYGTARMTILNNGNVGIGTTAPSTRTEVSGTLTVDALGQSANYYSEGIRLGAASNGYSIVTFGANPALSSGSQAHQWWIGKYGSDNGFNIWSYDAGGNVFHILSNGNVGIGTTNPTAKLDVNGLVKSTGLNVNGSGPYIFKNNNSSGYASLRIIANQTYGLELDSFGSNTSGAGTYYTGANGVALMNVNSAGLALGTSNTTRLLINSSGNIGVGTTNPGAKLDVNGYIRSTSGGIIYPNGITQSNAAKVTYGSFTVGGSSSSYYPVQFVNDIYNGNQASSNLVIFRSNVHENGSWYGTFNFEISFHPTDYGHFYGQIEKIIYETGQGSPYNDPVGNVMDGSGQGGGHDLIIWLKGGATYHFRNTDPTTGWTLTKGNSSGGNITDSSGVSLVPVTSQSTLIINAKNRFFTSAIGLGSNSLYITGSSRTQSLNISGFSGSAGTVMSDASGNLYTSAGSVGVGTGISGQTLRNNGTGWVATSNLYNNGTNVGIGTTNPVYKLDISSGNSPIRIGPNASYGRSLLLGGWGSSSGEAWIRTSNGNLHLDSKNGSNLYLNHYVPGTVYIGGGGGDTYIYGAIISPEGTLRDNGGGWVRTYGSTGWYSQSHGGGWYMTDSSWIRNYGSKPLYITGNNTNSAVFMSGNVGIGTAAPNNKLKVAGSLGIDRSVAYGGIWFNGGTDANHVLWSDYYGGPATRGAAGSGWDGIYWNTYNGLQVRTGTAGATTRFVIDGPNNRITFPNGNVGIGTTNPTSGYKLDVHGNILAYYANVVGQGLESGYGLSEQRLGPDGGNKPIVFYTSGGFTNEVVRFTTAGNVGIGITNPSSKLEVNGWYGRTAHSNGGLVGSYNNVGSNDAKSDPIYVIGSSYKPTDTTLNNMYGIGYSHANFWKTTSVGTSSGTSGWGLYVAADGDIREILDASTGIIWSSGSVRSPIFYDSNNTSYYLNPASTSNLSKIIAGGGSSSNWASINAGGGQSINAAGAIYSYNSICVNNNSGACNSAGGVVLGIANGSAGTNFPSSGNSFINNGGNLGIGTAAPGARLDVNGLLSLRAASGGRLGAGSRIRFATGGTSATMIEENYGLNLTGTATQPVKIYGASLGVGYTSSGANWGTTNLYVLGNIGIGTTNAGAKLTVNGGLKTTLANYLNGYSVNTGNSSIIVGNSIGETYALTAGIPNVTQAGFSINKLSSYSYGASIQYATPVFVVNNTNVGIGISAPAYKLDVAGPVHATEFVYGSDRALKKNIQPLTNSLQKIQELQGVSFNWKKGGEAQVGLIAQDVQKVYPELVHGKSGDMGVQYGNLVAPLIEAVKTQQAEIKDLQARVKVLETKVAH